MLVFKTSAWKASKLQLLFRILWPKGGGRWDWTTTHLKWIVVVVASLCFNILCNLGWLKIYKFHWIPVGIFCVLANSNTTSEDPIQKWLKCIVFLHCAATMSIYNPLFGFHVVLIILWGTENVKHIKNTNRLYTDKVVHSRPGHSVHDWTSAGASIRG